MLNRALAAILVGSLLFAFVPFRQANASSLTQVEISPYSTEYYVNNTLYGYTIKTPVVSSSDNTTVIGMQIVFYERSDVVGINVFTGQPITSSNFSRTRLHPSYTDNPPRTRGGFYSWVIVLEEIEYYANGQIVYETPSTSNVGIYTPNSKTVLISDPPKCPPGFMSDGYGNCIPIPPSGGPPTPVPGNPTPPPVGNPNPHPKPSPTHNPMPSPTPSATTPPWTCQNLTNAVSSNSDAVWDASMALIFYGGTILVLDVFSIGSAVLPTALGAIPFAYSFWQSLRRYDEARAELAATTCPQPQGVI